MESRVTAVMCLAFEARIAAGAGVALVCNGRRERLRDQVRHACEHSDGLISFGVAGGLDARLRSGDWIIATTVVSESGRFRTEERWTRRLCAALPGATCADISGLDAPVSRPIEKAAIGRAHRTVAIDTESHVVAEEATRHRIPFVVARVVLDPAWRELPPAALVPLNADGTPHLAGVMRSVLSKPSQMIGLTKVTADACRAWSALRRGRLSLGALFAFNGGLIEPEPAAWIAEPPDGPELPTTCAAPV